MPARLVYSPKAYVYTKSQDGVVYNLSNYVVSGEVQRKVSQVSSAQVTLRNPQKIFTGGGGQPRAFHPMDPITIYLERLQKHPVRVFTGYLDQTPYLQLFPGTISLTASCTLKRLLYTFFDPSLPYVNGFFAKYGWIRYNNGSMISSAAFPSGTQGTQADVNAGVKPFTDLSDGSLGKLLWAILYDIGEWQDANIWIEPLPTKGKGIATRIAALMQSIQQGESDARSEVTSFLKQVIGASSYGSGAGNPGSSTPGGAGGTVKSSMLNTNQNAFASAFSQASGMDPNVVAAWVISEEPSSSSVAPNGPNNWLNIGSSDSGFFGGGSNKWNDPVAAGQFSAQWMTGQVSLPGWGSASSGIQAIIKTAGQSPQRQIQAIQQSGWASSGYPSLPSVYQSILSSAGAAKPSSPSKTTTTQTGATAPAQPGTNSTKGYFPLPKGTYVPQSQWTPDQGIDIAAPGGTPLLAIADGTVRYINISGFSNGSDKNVPLLQLDTPIGGYNYVYYGHADTAGHTTDGSHVTAGQQIGEVGNGIVGMSTGPHLEIGFADASGNPVGTQSASTMMSTLQSVQAGQPVPGGGTGGTSGGATGTTAGSGNASAFVTELALPSIEDMTTAVALGTVHKGLMHDQNLLPFVQQVAQASLRSFQSLPNGDFYAFYPDYFGEMGQNQAYWDIKDIEILSGGIDLNDDALATHVFAVGDNTWPVSTELINDLLSTGSVNIFNAFVGNGIIDTAAIKKDAKGQGLDPGVMDAKEAVEFIQRYGARPLVQQYPMVRQPIFEMLLAYQQFMYAWSNQFKTPFTFTFMPELYPGGRVSFSDHGIQMYINSVTHTFNYAEGGFTTTAELTAPSLMNNVHAGDPGYADLPKYMVSALVEPIRLSGNTITPAPGDPGSVARQVAQGIASGVLSKIGTGFLNPQTAAKQKTHPGLPNFPNGAPR